MFGYRWPFRKNMTEFTTALINYTETTRIYLRGNFDSFPVDPWHTEPSFSLSDVAVNVSSNQAFHLELLNETCLSHRP